MFDAVEVKHTGISVSSNGKTAKNNRNIANDSMSQDASRQLGILVSIILNSDAERRQLNQTPMPSLPSLPPTTGNHMQTHLNPSDYGWRKDEASTPFHTLQYHQM
ncbi:hypothetical protein DPMN_115236 [Dreissena polymorpha]|uniref:Uncharacterized protein n=1 Tax=Dreissena polymorpha TaxID=45954 RepID=A0A9D4QT67_DREPO|nr:hypothetical protein DPMN_115236 [Dreissena polymorpha]